MFDIFDLELSHLGTNHCFAAQLQQTGYSHRFIVKINDVPFHFEPDDEGGYRAIIPYGADEKKYMQTDAALLKAVAEKIKELLA
ncbi:MAG: hypothetical protein ACO1NW_09045 [Chitinophagaceae bacterium]